MLEQSVLRQLIKDAKAGDVPSFERLVFLYQSLVLRVARRLLLDSEDAKDAAQEVFLRLHRSLGRVREESELAPWLYRVTVNICRDIRRRYRPEVSLAATGEPMNQERNPEQALTLAQQYEMALAGLGELTPREREIVVLRDLEGCSTSEVAEILGSTEGTVRCHLSTGRVKLRKFLSGQRGRAS